MQKSWVYIVTNTDMGKLYIGVTSNLRQRIMEHKTGAHPDGFSNKYNLRRLVWYREFSNI
ncbi:MAG: GIY-YIG nuclease family protein, partial [Rickettsiales bacterium]|nr:GIY-YIG nuclease family protein [Rickettsiales bacterium]